MKMKSIISVLCGLIWLQSCKQVDVVPDINQNPVYMVDGTLDNNPIRYEAGNAGLYMFTNFSASPQGLYTLTGTLRPQDSNLTEPFVEILINANKQVGLVFDYSIDTWTNQSLLKSYSEDLVQGGGSANTVLLSATNLFGLNSYKWYNNGALLDSNADYTQDNLANGNRTYEMRTFLNGIILESLTQSISIGSTHTFAPIKIDSLAQQNLVLASCSSNNNAQYFWNWGDGSTSTGDNVSHSYGANGYKLITLTQVLGTDSHIARQKIYFDSLGSGSILPSFNMTTSNTASLTPRVNLNSAIVRIKKSGSTYSSFRTGADNQSNNTILTLKSYLPGPNNELGQKTVIVDLAADLYLYNVANTADSIKFTTKSMVMGLAVPR
jgi:hypothetical protein